MRRARWLLYLWPGLPQLWWQGALSALAVAVGFALALDVALLATWVWSELLAASVRPLVWPVLGLVWIGGIGGDGLARAERRGDGRPRPARGLVSADLGRILKGELAGSGDPLSAACWSAMPATPKRCCCWPPCCGTPAGPTRPVRLWPNCGDWTPPQPWEQEIDDELARLAEKNRPKERVPIRSLRFREQRN